MSLQLRERGEGRGRVAGSQGFTAFMLTVFRLISLTVASTAYLVRVALVINFLSCILIVLFGC